MAGERRERAQDGHHRVRLHEQALQLQGRDATGDEGNKATAAVGHHTGLEIGDACRWAHASMQGGDKAGAVDVHDDHNCTLVPQGLCSSRYRPHCSASPSAAAR